MIKSFNSIMYEGSQGKVQRGSGYTDNNFYGYKSLYDKKGWYVQTISTEKSKGSVLNFLEKEDKWFGSIRGKSHNVNDIDLKNFSVQGIGTISSVDVVVPPYNLNAGNITLSNPSNTFNTSTINYSFTPATQTGSVQFPITYTVEINTGTQGLQTLMTTDTNGNPTALHEPNTTYSHTVSSNTDTNDVNNNHTFVVTATDSNGETVGGFDFMNSISTYASAPLSVPAPTLTVDTSTQNFLIIDFNAASAVGGTPPYTYSGTWAYGFNTGNIVNITPNIGVDIPVNVTPVPSPPVDIAFNLNVVDSLGNAASSSNIINAGYTAPPPPPISMGTMSFNEYPVGTGTEAPGILVTNILGNPAPANTYITIGILEISIASGATGGDGGPYTYQLTLSTPTGSMAECGPNTTPAGNTFYRSSGGTITNLDPVPIDSITIPEGQLIPSPPGNYGKIYDSVIIPQSSTICTATIVVTDSSGNSASFSDTLNLPLN